MGLERGGVTRRTHALVASGVSASLIPPTYMLISNIVRVPCAARESRLEFCPQNRGAVNRNPEIIAFEGVLFPDRLCMIRFRTPQLIALVRSPVGHGTVL